MRETIKINSNTLQYRVFTSTKRKKFVGHINPFELGIGDETKDIWVFQLPNPTNIIIINNSNVSNLQSIINNAVINTRLFFVAGTYEIGNIQLAGKPIQFVGELDSQGNNLVTFEGSQDISGNTWTLDTGKYRTTVTSIVNQLPRFTAEEQIGFYALLTEQIWVNNIPYNPVPSIATMLNPRDFYYDSATNQVHLQAIPTGVVKWGKHNHCIAQSNSNDGTLATSIATDNAIFANFNCNYYGGNRLGAVIGRRGYNKIGNIVPKYSAYYNVKIEYCRGIAFRADAFCSMINCKSYNNGSGSMYPNRIDPDIYNAGWNIATAKYSSYWGNRMYANGSVGDEGGASTKFINAFFVHLKQCEHSHQGITSIGVIPSGYSMWLDDCSYIKIEDCYFHSSSAGNLFVEIAQFIEVWKTKLHPCLSGFHIFNSTSNDVHYHNNDIISIDENAVFRLGDGDRFNTDNYEPFVLRDNVNVIFENNVIDLKSNRLAYQTTSSRTGRISPAYKNYTGKNILFRNNTYKTQNPNLLSDFTVDLFVGLSAIQALTDSNNVSFNWEQGSVLI